MVPLDISKFVSEILNPLYCPAAAQEFLLRLRFSGGKYSDFAEVLQGLPESEENLLKACNQLFESKLKEKITNPSVALSMIGFLPARNFLAASLTGGDKNQLLPGNPEINRRLHYALDGERNGGDFPTDFFLGGIIFDLLVTELVPVNELKMPGGMGDYIDAIWEHSNEVAKTACKMSAQLVPDLGLEKDLVLDGLLHDVGKIGFRILDAQEESNLSNGPQTSENRWKNEHSAFGIAHDALGYLILSKLGFVKETAWVVLYHHQPYLAKRQGESILIRSIMIWLADHLIRYREQHKTKNMGERFSQNWFKIVKNGIPTCTEKDFKNAMSAAGG